MATNNLFPLCQKLLGHHKWQQVVQSARPPNNHKELIEHLSRVSNAALDTPGYIPDLARIEYALNLAGQFHHKQSNPINKYTLNPSLEVIEVNHQGLPSLVNENSPKNFTPVPGHEFILIWQNLTNKESNIKTAEDRDLLSLKIISEELDLKQLAKEHQKPIGYFDNAIDQAARQGLILTPDSKLTRSGPDFSNKECAPDFLLADVFTLQWHITQACDLHCKHCYDRSNMQSMDFNLCISLLDQMRDFCRSRYIDGQISFTGGNPFLHPQFFDLYEAAAERNLGTAILGNVITRSQLERCLKIQKPSFYQVSLEGLRDHNDAIRGSGYFDKIMGFLDLLKNYDIYSMVMLTLTNNNIEQVLPLAEELRGKVDLFTFNRLAMVGEGAGLTSAESTKYRQFLQAYTQAAIDNPTIAFKDNLFNILRHEKGEKLFGGCAGFGCGAAFNFVSVLPDGQIHACRKYPSPIGDLVRSSLKEIYDSKPAQRYRQGSTACTECRIRPVCGGCPAVVHGLGKDPFTDLDPYCFIAHEINTPELFSTRHNS